MKRINRIPLIVHPAQRNQRKYSSCSLRQPIIVVIGNCYCAAPAGAAQRDGHRLARLSDMSEKQRLRRIRAQQRQAGEHSAIRRDPSGQPEQDIQQFPANPAGKDVQTAVSQPQTIRFGNRRPRAAAWANSSRRCNQQGNHAHHTVLDSSSLESVSS